jgi:TRAP-type uncharacterized transport system fused permease subunit
MAERKAFISPYWAICAGCVLVALFAYFVIAPTIAKADDGCVPISDAVSAAMAQGAEVFLVEDRMEVARGVGFINSNGGWAYGVTGFLVAVYQTIDLGEIYPVKDGLTCGFNRSTRADALRFFEIVKTPAGRPA